MANEVKTFYLPSIHGWKCDNSYKFQGSVYELYPNAATWLAKLFWKKDGTYGFCGGMAWSSLDRFYLGKPVDPTTNVPLQGTPLYEEILKRQQQSAKGWFRLWWWHNRPTTSAGSKPSSISHLVRTEEWPKLKSLLDQGYPIPLMLMIKHVKKPKDKSTDITDNHQVVACRYKMEWKRLNNRDQWVVTVWIYDPNRPDDDNARIAFRLGESNIWMAWAATGTGQGSNKYRGFYVNDYDRQNQVRAPRVSNVHLSDVKLIRREIVRIGATNRHVDEYSATLRCTANFMAYYGLYLDGQPLRNALSANQETLPPIVMSRSRIRNDDPHGYNIPIGFHIRAEDPWFHTLKAFIANLDHFSHEIPIEVLPPQVECEKYIRVAGRSQSANIPGTYDLVDAENEDVVKMEDSPNSHWDPMTKVLVMRRKSRGSEGLIRFFVKHDEDACGYLKNPVYCNFHEQGLVESEVSRKATITTRRPRQSPTKTVRSNLLASRCVVHEGFVTDDYNQDRMMEFQYEVGDPAYKVKETITLTARARLSYYTLWTERSPLPREDRFEGLIERIREHVEWLRDSSTPVPDWNLIAIGVGDYIVKKFGNVREASILTRRVNARLTNQKVMNQIRTSFAEQSMGRNRIAALNKELSALSEQTLSEVLFDDLRKVGLDKFRQRVRG